jgi:phenylpropionate dioxygenase-like ring-hydroxylating dioxygenase large terminal subunit
MFVRNCWYVAAWDKEVPADGLFARTIIDIPLVLWRDGAGAIIALEDRCCHRGAPLSLGRKEGPDCIRCMYHGLVFDSAGQCVSAAAQERIPPGAVVRRYAALQRHRWIWVWMGDPQEADETLIPDTRWLDHPDWRSLDGYLHYDVNYLLIADNLLDFSHLPYLHPTTVGGSTDYAAILPSVERFEQGIRLSKLVHDTEPPAYSASLAPFNPGARVDRWMHYEFLVPGVLLMDTGMVPAGGDTSDRDPRTAVAFRGCQALTPETDGSTHYFFAHAHNAQIDRPEVTAAIHANVERAFEEDRMMITAQHRNLQRDPAFKMVPLSVDSALAQFRWLIDQRISQELGAA